MNCKDGVCENLCYVFSSDFVDSDRRPAQFSNYIGVIIMIVSMLSTRYNSLSLR